MKPNKTIAWLLMVALLAGCVTRKPTFETAQGFNGKTAALKKIGVIVDAKVTYTKALLPPTPADRAEATALETQGTDNMRDEINRALSAKGYTVVMLPLDDDARALLKEYDAAHGNNIDTPFPATRGTIAALAPLPAAAALATRAGVDGIVIVKGRDSKASTGAAALTVVALVIFVVVIAAAISAGDQPPLPGPTPYDADFAFIDRTGKIEFYERANMAVLNRGSVQRANIRFSDDIAPQR